MCRLHPYGKRISRDPCVSTSASSSDRVEACVSDSSNPSSEPVCRSVQRVPKGNSFRISEKQYSPINENQGLYIPDFEILLKDY